MTGIRVADDHSFVDIPARRGMSVFAYRTASGEIGLMIRDPDDHVAALAVVTPEAFAALTSITPQPVEPQP